jgi:hypothetical protein
MFHEHGHSPIDYIIIEVGVLIICCDAPPSPLSDSKELDYVKGGSRWDLVPLLASSTKGGERGVLKALGLD